MLLKNIHHTTKKLPKYFGLCYNCVILVEADRNTGKGQKMRKEEVRETGIAGIKQRIKDGKYIVSLDLGREIITDPKTGKRKEKQRKTTKVVNTLKEAKALLGENNAAKRHKKLTGATGKVYIENVIKDYKEKYYDSDKHWSDSYKQQKTPNTPTSSIILATWI